MALDKTFAVGEVLNAADVNGHLLGVWIPIDKRVIASGSATSTISFASLDSNFRLFRLTFLEVSATTSELTLRFNNDTGNNYSSVRAYGLNTGNGLSAETENVNAMELGIGDTDQHLGQLIIAKFATTTHANVSGPISGILSFANYSINVSGRWTNTSALINRIDLIGKSSGTMYGVFALEGMRGV